MPEDLDVRIELSQKCAGTTSTPQSTPVLARQQAGMRCTVGRDECGGEIAGADVLGQRTGDVAGDGFLEGVDGVGHGEAGILRGRPPHSPADP